MHNRTTAGVQLAVGVATSIFKQTAAGFQHATFGLLSSVHGSDGGDGNGGDGGGRGRHGGCHEGGFAQRGLPATDGRSARDGGAFDGGADGQLVSARGVQHAQLRQEERRGMEASTSARRNAHHPGDRTDRPVSGSRAAGAAALPRDGASPSGLNSPPATSRPRAPHTVSATGLHALMSSMGVTSDEDATDGDSEAPVGQHPWSYAGRRTGLDGAPRRRLDIVELAPPSQGPGAGQAEPHDVWRQAVPQAAPQELDTLLQTQQKVAHLRQQAEQRRRATEQAVADHERRATMAQAQVESQESAH